MTSKDVIFHYQQYDKTKKYYTDRFSTLGGKLVNSMEKAIVKSFFKKAINNEKILDLGTGTGRIAAWFQTEKVGVDSSIPMLKQAKRTGLDVVCSDIKHLPFRNATFSTIIAVRVFIRVEQPLLIFKEVARVLSNRGRFIFETSNKCSIGYFINRFSQEPPHTMFSRNGMQRYLLSTAFKIVDIKPSFIVPRGFYQKIDSILLDLLWFIDRLFLKTRLSRMACTLFWQANLMKHPVGAEEP